MASRICYFCDTKSHMSIVENSGRLRKVRQGFDIVYEAMAAFLCDECRAMSIGTRIFTDANAPRSERVEGHLEDRVDGWLPVVAIGREFMDVPEHIASPASEAYECHSIGAYRGAAALARAVVEATAKDNGITSGQLFHKIEQMEKQGLIRAHIRMAADEIRHLGNGMAHGDFADPVDEVESEEVLAHMSEILHDVYQSPALIERTRAARIAKKEAKKEASSDT